MANDASSAAYRTSHAAAMSTPRPSTSPCAESMTGCLHRSMDEMADWNFRICSLSLRPVRAGSSKVVCKAPVSVTSLRRVSVTS